MDGLSKTLLTCSYEASRSHKTDEASAWFWLTQNNGCLRNHALKRTDKHCYQQSYALFWSMLRPAKLLLDFVRQLVANAALWKQLPSLVWRFYTFFGGDFHDFHKETFTCEMCCSFETTWSSIWFILLLCKCMERQ